MKTVTLPRTAYKIGQIPWNKGMSIFIPNKLTCLTCGIGFQQKRKDRPNQSFCSIKCSTKNLHRPEIIKKRALTITGSKISEETKKKMSIARTGKKTSEETRKKQSLVKKGKTGELASRWSGGKTPFYKLIRASFEYKEWHSAILHRDDFTCQHCFVRGGDLEVDHIKRFSTIIKEYKIESIEDSKACAELWDIFNGRTLCKPCHKKVTFNKQNI